MRKITILLDVLVLCQEPVQPLALIKARAIGLMTMIDSGASDDKVIAVATNDPEFSDYLEARDLPPHRLLVLRRFFQDYKQLEGKQVQVEEIRPAYAALAVIEKSLANYQHTSRAADEQRWKVANRGRSGVVHKYYSDCRSPRVRLLVENSMNLFWKWAIGIVLVLLVAVFVGLSLMAGSPKDAYGMVRYALPHMHRGNLKVGDDAPDAKLVALDGTDHFHIRERTGGSRWCWCLGVLPDRPFVARSATSLRSTTTTKIMRTF